MLSVDALWTFACSMSLWIWRTRTKSLKSEKVSGVTHVFHTAFAGDMTNTDRRVAYMLDHLPDGLEANGESLQHVYFSTGLKYYGEQQSIF